MGTITARKRKDGTTGYTAQILRKKGGAIVLREAKTFDKEREAKAWIRFREGELDRPGALDRAAAPSSTLADAIDRYVLEKTEIGRTKAQVLRSIKDFTIADMDCSKIGASDISGFAQELLAGGRKPQTVGNYISHLSAVFSVARPLWGLPLDLGAMRDAQAAMSKVGSIGKSEKRNRRPTLPELDLLMQHFADRQARAPHSAPMHLIIPFAIFSTRRQEEITRITWADLDEQHSRVLVRDMKHPGQKKGNDVWCELPPEALRIALAMPHRKAEIFPYSTDAISAAFTRACQFLHIDDLRFHDLRHEGVSRLFELGRTIPLAASVSGHRSWSSLQRYAHLRESGDKFANWKWMDILTRTETK
ncbi:tyrosine-type recombinase/integrase [Rhizobium sp. S95]|uniref:Tyrosine-type recombinase/integrase n=1 Tax=Ciceribacter sichuanensis TaxID=2949647 RepID=A0AAJ1FKY5_9HYPH|nr:MULTISPECIES: tyrosine-type recombinase/integrase [unclassified Ciceribacter]MCM2399442.1 tyrosine-type recombinase/integrase [Ciceribacter sp. S95]MCO5959766.1 tyrosine-type recombinase/integrase [Ciceribacter sp. S101]